MAKKKYVVVVDDLTGEDIPKNQDRTAILEVNGVRVEIDMSPETAASFDEQMQPWLEAGRRVAAPVRTRRVDKGGETPRNSPEYLAKVREFARKKGIKVADRGRIAKWIRDEYDTAHGA